jgi:hypothetical protein
MQYFLEKNKRISDMIKRVQADLDKPMRQKIICLNPIEAHSRDIIEKHILRNVLHHMIPVASQLKTYFDTDNKAKRFLRTYLA